MRGRYLPVDLLGQGGFGTAFLAKDFDSPTQRSCVVKLFQPPVTLTPQQMATAQRLFGKEAIVLERLGLQHPQIPNLYAYFPLLVTNPLNNQSEELFYLVQEFVDGEDLEKTLERQGKFNEADVTRVLRAMLDVLSFVHENGAIHRDVKPSNIMQGKDGRLSLLDFGAVKEVTTPTSAQHRGPTTICSPEYAPPEQIMNGTVDQTSDLYALAATCVVLLTDMASGDLRDSVSNRWRWQRHAQVSPALATILDRMLRPNPRDRYPTAKAVHAALTPSKAATRPSIGIAPPVSPPAVSSPLQGQNQSQNQGQNRSQNRSQNQAAPPPPPVAKKAAKPPKPVRPPAATPTAPLSLRRFLGNAAFSGVEGGLIAIAATSLLGTGLVGHAAWLVLLAGLGTLQFLRVIEGFDLVMITGVTLAIVAFFGRLHQVLEEIWGVTGLEYILVIVLMTGGAMVAIAVIFRLIFRLLSRIM